MPIEIITTWPALWSALVERKLATNWFHAMKRIALALVWGLGSALSGGTAVYAQGTILNTKHDLATARVALCTHCHIPHDVPAPKLWARVPKIGGSGLQALCFGCHDGTVTNKGWFIWDRMNYKTHNGRPGVKRLDCDLCHDPHLAEWKFLNTLIRDANVCADCHGTGMNTHPSDVSAARYPPTDAIWNPYAVPPDFSGTRLWDADSVTLNETGSIKCLTCHTPHGAVKSSRLNSMTVRESRTTQLCLNCHR